MDKFCISPHTCHNDKNTCPSSTQPVQFWHRRNYSPVFCFLQMLQCYAQVAGIPCWPWSRNWRIMPYPKIPPRTWQTAGHALWVHQSSHSLYVAINISVDQQRALWKKTNCHDDWKKAKQHQWIQTLSCYFFAAGNVCVVYSKDKCLNFTWRNRQSIQYSLLFRIYVAGW